MGNIKHKLKKGALYNSRGCGKFEILKVFWVAKISIKFIDTGGTTYATSYDILKGNVTDLFKPTVAWVGFKGKGKHLYKVNGVNTQAYNVWASMINRCYNPNYLRVNPIYKDCIVCKHWHNFQNFAQWFNTQDTEGLQLDNDMRVSGNTVYSPNFCKFVTPAENSEKANAKSLKLINEKGEVVKVYNLAKWCKLNRLNYSGFMKLKKGILKNTQGFKLAPKMFL